MVDTEKEAIAKKDRINAISSRYIRRNKPARVTPWSNYDQTENKFLVWYYY